MFRNLTIAIMMFFALATLAACEKSGGGGINPNLNEGLAGGPCFADGTCNAGLVCNAGTKICESASAPVDQTFKSISYESGAVSPVAPQEKITIDSSKAISGVISYWSDEKEGCSDSATVSGADFAQLVTLLKKVDLATYVEPECENVIVGVGRALTFIGVDDRINAIGFQCDLEATVQSIIDEIFTLSEKYLTLDCVSN